MPETNHPRFILASASPRRLQLLKQAGLAPAAVIAAEIDETPLKNELPAKYAMRVAGQKAMAVAAQHPDSIVLAADTVVACGRRILPKAEDEKTVAKCLRLLSGRRHRVYTALCVQTGDKQLAKLVMTQVRFGRLSDMQVADYAACGDGIGKAGGYAIQGRAEAFIPWINGSYSSVVGLPLAEACALLKQAGLAW